MKLRKQLVDFLHFFFFISFFFSFFFFGFFLVFCFFTASSLLCFFFCFFFCFFSIGTSSFSWKVIILLMPFPLILRNFSSPFAVSWSQKPSLKHQHMFQAVFSELAVLANFASHDILAPHPLSNSHQMPKPSQSTFTQYDVHKFCTQASVQIWNIL